jgi:hypothetical protein
LRTQQKVIKKPGSNTIMKNPYISILRCDPSILICSVASMIYDLIFYCPVEHLGCDPNETQLTSLVFDENIASLKESDLEVRDKIVLFTLNA